MRLKDRVAIVTGGSSGIGRGIALELAGEGARVVVADIREAARVGKYYETEPRAPTAEQINADGGEAMYVQTDVADAGQVEAMIAAAVERFGGLDILVSNAGMAMSGTSQSLTIDDWDHGMAVLLRAAFVGTKFAAPHLKRSDQGRIIHITSVWATRGGCSPVYTAAKAGLDNLARDSAMELAKDSVTVNTIRPGFVETAIQDYLTPEQIDTFRERHPLPRFGTPRDIGRAVVFLASDDGSWITGETLTVDGGLTCPL